jgi:1-acyl-sn-glycerol-3-phosphate acyltransferase
VLPIGIWGTERVLPKGARWPARAPVHVRIGEPAAIPRTDARGRRLSSQEIADLLMRRVAAVLPPGRRGVFAGTTSGGAAPPSTPSRA